MIKDELMKAVKVAAELYNSGESADDAIVKTAERMDFNEKQAERLAEMFNTLVAINQEKKAEDPTGTCELADKKKILAKLTLGQEKKASADVSAYSFYGADPLKTNPIMEARASGRKMEKAASAAETVPAELDVSQRSLYKIINGKIENLKTAADAADEVVRCLRLEVERGCVKIAKALDAYGAPVDMFKAACGKEALKAVSEYSVKVASSDGGEYANTIFDSSPVDDLLKEAEEIERNLAAIPEYERKRDFYASKAAEAQGEMMDAVGLSPDQGSGNMSDFFSEAPIAASEPAPVDLPGAGVSSAAAGQPPAAAPAADLSVKVAELIRKSGVPAEDVEKLADDLEKSAVSFMPTMSMSTNEVIDAISRQESVSDEDRRLQNAYRAALLADLVPNDPILRDADPRTIMEAYKTMIMTAPRVSLDPTQVRSFLRAAANSVAISSSDAKVLSDVDYGTARSNLERLTSLDSSVKDSNRA